MKKVRVWMSANWVGCEEEEIVEVDDNTTASQLNDVAFNFAQDFIDYGWEEIPDEGESEEGEEE